MSGPARVLFFGYGTVGCDGLRALLDGGVRVAGVFCRESDRDPSAGDGSVRALAARLGLPVYPHRRPDEPAFLAEAAALAPDYLISLQYDRILKPALLAVPRHGSLNLHFGPLPRLRGCFPTKWAILEDEPGGVALHRIDPGVDTGAVLGRRLAPLAEGETDQTLYAKLCRAGATLFREHVDAVRELRVPAGVPQDESSASYHPKAVPYGGVVDWTRGVDFAERFVRAFTFPPHPGARARLGELELELRAPARKEPGARGAPGSWSLDAAGRLGFACPDGTLWFERAWVDGRELPARELPALARGEGRVA